MRNLFLRGGARARLLLRGSTTTGALSATSASAFTKPSEARLLHCRRSIPQFHSLTVSAYKVTRMSSRGGNGADSSTVHFTLSPSSALVIQKGDITKWSVDGSSDAIVRTLAHSLRPPLCQHIINEGIRKRTIFFSMEQKDCCFVINQMHVIALFDNIVLKLIYQRTLSLMIIILWASEDL